MITDEIVQEGIDETLKNQDSPERKEWRDKLINSRGWLEIVTQFISTTKEWGRFTAVGATTLGALEIGYQIAKAEQRKQQQEEHGLNLFEAEETV